MYNSIEIFIRKHFSIIFYILTVFLLCIGVKVLSGLFLSNETLPVFVNFSFLFFPNKYGEILNYIFGAGMIFLMFLLYPLYNKMNFSFVGKNAAFSLLIYLFSILIFFSIKSQDIIKLSIVLFFMVLSVFVCFNLARGDYLEKFFIRLKSNKYNKILFNSIIFLSIFMFILQIYPFVFGNLKVINEFSDIPELTVINNKTINSLEFENQEFKNNPIKDKVEIKKYIKANKTEIHWKTLSRWVLYHHSHMLVPALELELNKDKSQIFAQYGLFNSNLLRLALKHTGGINFQTYFKLYYSFFYIYYALLFVFVNKMTKSKNYTLITILGTVISINIYNFYYIYLAPGCNPMRHFLDIIVVFLLYKYFTSYRIRYFLLSAFLSLFAVLLNWNMGLFLYLALIPLFYYKNCIVKKTVNAKKELVIILGSFLIFPFIYHYSTIGADYTKEYFTKGLLGWPLSSFVLASIFLIIIASYILFIKIKDRTKNSNLKLTAFFSFMYAQGLLLYFIWGSDAKHFVVIAPFVLFVLLMIIKLFIDEFLEDKFVKFRKIAANIIVIGLFIAAMFGFATYIKDYSDFNYIFKKHIVYNWNFKNAKFKSTINPSYFEDSIELMKKYSKDDKGVYIISKYDHFIPFLADKYTLMPYINLEWYVLSNKEVDTVVNLIKSEKPKILYVDKNIMYSNSECYSVYDRNFYYLNNECQAHIDRVKTLDKIFNEVRKDYMPIESSYLLTVYRRKNEKN